MVRYPGRLDGCGKWLETLNRSLAHDLSGLWAKQKNAQWQKLHGINFACYFGDFIYCNDKQDALGYFYFHPS